MKRELGSRSGTFVVSLDLELNWGMHDVLPLEVYGDNILGGRQAIPEMLQLFKTYEIHATWAAVGMLSFETKEGLKKHIPNSIPSYTNEKLSAYNHFEEIGDNEEEDPYHYGLSLIGKVMETPHQELASHTFSHFYCLEEGQTIQQFESDLKEDVKVKESLGVTIHSIVFPRNQMSLHYLNSCKKMGIRCYRGNEQSWFYRAESVKHKQSTLKRIMRIMDAYLNISGHNTYPMEYVKTEPLYNIPSSRFLRPYSVRLSMLEQLRMKRIKDSMTEAAKEGKVYHLWWHPHNFGRNISENLAFLEEILVHYKHLHAKYHMNSMNMGEISAYMQTKPEVSVVEEKQKKSV